jgi:hypothetical protein
MGGDGCYATVRTDGLLTMALAGCIVGSGDMLGTPGWYALKSQAAFEHWLRLSELLDVLAKS